MSTISGTTGYFSEALPIRLASKALQLQWRVVTIPWSTFLFWMSCCCSLLLRFLIIAGAPPGEFYNKTKVSPCRTEFHTGCDVQVCRPPTHYCWPELLPVVSKASDCPIRYGVVGRGRLVKARYLCSSCKCFAAAGEGSQLRCGASATEPARPQKYHQGGWQSGFGLSGRTHMLQCAPRHASLVSNICLKGC